MRSSEKLYQDDEFGIIRISRNIRSRNISLRIKSRPYKNGGRVSITIPRFCSFKDGIYFLNTKRSWVRIAFSRQKMQNAEAEEKGHAVIDIGNGTTVKTLLSEICFEELDPSQKEIVTAGKDISIKTEQLKDPELDDMTWFNLDRPFFRKTVYYLKDRGITEPVLEKILVEILRKEAKELLIWKIHRFEKAFGFKANKVTIKHNSSNWGSCSRSGNINLNLNIMRLPELLCDYILIHELCHLAEPNHGPRFHSMLNSLCNIDLSELAGKGNPEVQKYVGILARNDNKSHLDRIISREIREWRLL